MWTTALSPPQGLMLLSIYGYGNYPAPYAAQLFVVPSHQEHFGSRLIICSPCFFYTKFHVACQVETKIQHVRLGKGNGFILLGIFLSKQMSMFRLTQALDTF